VFQGYQQDFIVFFPLYPALIRLTTFDFVYINLSALIVSNVGSGVAAVFLFKLAKLDFDEGIAKKAVLYLCVFPTAYFLSAIYSEGLFLALTIASFYFARTGKWYATGILALLAALTRFGGLLLIPALLIEYFHQKRWRLRSVDGKVLWVFLSFAGFLIFLFINFQVAGNPLAFVEIERTNWNQTFNPFAGFGSALQFSISMPFPENTYTIAELAFAAFGLSAVVVGFWLRFRLSYCVYMLLAWMLSVSMSQWMSVPRYMLAMFPMFILLATLTQKKTAQWAVTLLFSVLLCFFTILFAVNRFVF
jgi:Gpi18-like mannosyltransferase